MQMTLDGFNDYYGPNEGLQERATKELIESFVGDRQLDPNAKYVCKTMINIARNFDALNVKGRDTSRHQKRQSDHRNAGDRKHHCR